MHGGPLQRENPCLPSCILKKKGPSFAVAFPLLLILLPLSFLRDEDRVWWSASVQIRCMYPVSHKHPSPTPPTTRAMPPHLGPHMPLCFFQTVVQTHASRVNQTSTPLGKITRTQRQHKSVGRQPDRATLVLDICTTTRKPKSPHRGPLQVAQNPAQPITPSADYPRSHSISPWRRSVGDIPDLPLVAISRTRKPDSSVWSCALIWSSRMVIYSGWLAAVRV